MKKSSHLRPIYLKWMFVHEEGVDRGHEIFRVGSLGHGDKGGGERVSS